MDAPTGIFDSQVRGLTLACVIAYHMPYREIVYVGETAKGANQVAAVGGART
jgi:glutamate racemase